MPPPSNPDGPRPILKVNTASRQSSFSGDVGTPTPSSESRKIKIRLSSQPTTPAATSAGLTPVITKSKAGRTSKPTAKLIESKKRGYDSDEDQPLSSRPSKMIKIKPNVTKRSSVHSYGVSTPVSSIKFKPRGEPVEHNPGEAYDSEASDREPDPIRETAFILRVLPGPSTEYLRKALSEGAIGIPKQNGGADFNVQFIDAKERRALVTIDGKFYAAVLVHLPTVTEAMKSWDRKNMMKNSNITEMLLCFQEVQNELEAKTVPLPPMVVKNEHRWPHGLTPPMHDAVHRRFRKTVSEKQWQAAAMEAARLAEEDAAAIETHYETLIGENDDPDTEDERDAYEGRYGDEDEVSSRRERQIKDEGQDEDQDADGEVDQDYFENQPGMQNDNAEDAEYDAEMLAAMEAELAEDAMEFDESVAATPNIPLEAANQMMVDADTPAGMAEIISEEDEDDDDDDDDDMEDGDEEVDEEQLVAERERKEKLDEIEHLKKGLDEIETQLAGTAAPILRKRILSRRDNLRREIAVKRAALGLEADD